MFKLQKAAARAVGTRAVHAATAPAATPSLWDKLLNKSSMPGVPLNIEFPDTQQLGTGQAVEHKGVESTTLPNGLRIVSQNSGFPISGVGAFIDAGSRYETHSNSGISHFLELIAFKSTTNRSDFKLVRDMTKQGAKVVCSTSREHTVYAAESLREYMPQTVATLGDVIQNQAFNQSELMEAKETYLAGIHAREGQADIQIMEAIHGAAYFNDTIGLPMYAPKHNLDGFTTESLVAHTKAFFTPERIVVGGVGVDHGEFVQEVASAFGDMAKTAAPPMKKANYTGGEIRMHLPGNVDPLTHVAIAFETASWHHKDVVAMCVLQMMMGGGRFFSAGGPGKGMYSRLYERVMNRHAYVDSATCFNAIFTDSSLFGIYGTAEASNAGKITEVLATQLKEMTGPVGAEELSRAKNMLKSAVVMQLETQGLKLEDMGRQMLTYGKVQHASEICAQVDAVTGADVQRVASEMLKTTPSVAAYGDLSYLPRYDSIASMFK